jgi:hypothetical protein
VFSLPDSNMSLYEEIYAPLLFSFSNRCVTTLYALLKKLLGEATIGSGSSPTMSVFRS